MNKTSGVLACAVVMAVAAMVARAGDAGTEGEKPFTPSRLEWLAVYLNATARVTFADSGYRIDFVPLKNKGTILVHASYLEKSDRDRLKMDVETAKKVAALYAKDYEWDSWLKIEESVKRIE